MLHLNQESILLTQFISTSLLLWIKSGSLSTLDHPQMMIETGSSLDHHQCWIIIGSSSKMDHHWIIIKTISLIDHHWIIIITASTILIKWCYLSILLIIGSSIEPALFHVGCRPSLHIGLLQLLYLTLSHNGPLSTYI